jgi:lysozyme
MKKYIIEIIALSFIGVGVLFLVGWVVAIDIKSKINTDKETIGIDVSHHQKKIDWSKVRKWQGKPIEFVYMKATEGATYQDPKYKYNIKHARANGLKVGSYHYFRTSSSVDDQFNNLIRNVKKNEQDLIPVIDVEECRNWDIKTFHRNLQEFLDKVEKHYGTKPMIYCVNSFYNKYLLRYSGYKLMIGRYSRKSPMMIKGDWTVWQFSESGKVDGIPRNVDINTLSQNLDVNVLQYH